MIRRSITSAALGLLALCLGTACDEDSGTPGTTRLTIRLATQVADDPFVRGGYFYTTPAGARFAIDEVALIVGTVTLVADDGSSYVVEPRHAYFSDDPESDTIVLDGVPRDGYDRITITIGLSDVANVTGSLGDDPRLDALAWPEELGGGYQFVRLAGMVKDAAPAAPFLLQLGRLVRGDETTSFAVDVDVPGDGFNLTGSSHALEAAVDIGVWVGATGLDLGGTAEGTASDAAALAALQSAGEEALRAPTPENEPVEPVAPDGFPPMIVPADNPATRVGVMLGRMLYYDPILSADSTLACAGCHRPSRSFADVDRFSLGTEGERGDRNAPALINPGWTPIHFWDGRAASLEEQALGPVENPIEMNLPWEEAVPRLERSDRYRALFRRAFGTEEITRDRVVKAIGQFERTLVSADARIDRVLYGRTETFTPLEAQGWTLFFSEVTECFHCHGTSALFTDNLFHDIGLDAEPPDGGRGDITKNPREFGMYKTPTLRNLAFTAPYMHDGRFNTLREVIDHYDSGGHGSPNVDPLIRVGIGLGMTDGEKDALEAFINTLNDPDYLINPAYQNPFE